MFESPKKSTQRKINPTHNQSKPNLETQIRDSIQTYITQQIFPFSELPPAFHLPWRELDTFLNEQECQLLRLFFWFIAI
jgi:hypothetical protein